MKQLAVSLTLLLCITLGVYGQSSMFDDGRKGDAQHFVKWDATTLLQGDLAFHYEYSFGKAMGIDVGAGVTLPFYVYHLSDIMQDAAAPTPLSGYSYRITPKYYYQKTAGSGVYVGAMYRKRHFSTLKKEYDRMYFALIIGGQVHFNSHLALDLYWGFGGRVTNSQYKDASSNDLFYTSYDDGFAGYFPLIAKLVYIL